VEFRYQPRSFVAGAVLSTIGLGILGLLVWRQRYFFA
jgi:hypothetical protein